MMNARLKANGNNGFTMIELMVVLVIVSSLIGLVGPLVIDSITKYEIKTEEQSLQKQLTNLSLKSFLIGRETTIQLKGNKLLQLNGEQEIFSKEFKFLRFNEQSFMFNSSGVTSQAEVSYSLVEQPLSIKSIDLAEVVYAR